MTQILLIGGKRDGEIVEDDFKPGEYLRRFNSVVTSSNSQNSANSTIDKYLMDSVRVDGHSYAYGVCRTTDTNEISELIRSSGVKPIT